MPSNAKSLTRSMTAPARLVRSHYERPGRGFQSPFKRIRKPKPLRCPTSSVLQTTRRAVQQIFASAKNTGRGSGARRNILVLGPLRFAPPSDFDTVLVEAQNPQDAVERVTIPVDQGLQRLCIDEPYPAKLSMLIESRLLDQIDGLVGDSVLTSPTRPTPLSTPVNSPARCLSDFSAVAKKADQLLCDEKI